MDFIFYLSVFFNVASLLFFLTVLGALKTIIKEIKDHKARIDLAEGFLIRVAEWAINGRSKQDQSHDGENIIIFPKK
jgi:hypothetical protein